MKKQVLFSIILSFLLCSCINAPDPLPLGVANGNKSAGVIVMNWEKRSSDSIKLTDSEQNYFDREATKRCKNWGYRTFEPFDFIERQCAFLDTVWTGQCKLIRFSHRVQCVN